MSADAFNHAALCRTMARRFTRGYGDAEDLEQVAQLGLLKAVRKFEPERGVPFSAFARRNICGELMHYVRDYERTVRMPRSWWELRHRERASTDAFIAHNGRMPTPADIARDLGTSPTAVAIMRNGGIATDVLSAEPAAQYESADHRIILGDALAALAPLERAMIIGVYFCGYTQLEVGAKLGIAQRRASRLHARALHHLRTIIGEI